ncbi:MAG: metalloregulator ArsR/SmtB family transcription factor [Chloroflexi bacterium]|nr:metalloregulator ArsR/SmtB family transcription factor [Chloroflexota bacterium]
MKTNATSLGAEAVTERISGVLQAIGPEVRLQIILAIGRGEACVCHLEAILGERQAYISQQLMALREVGVITARREGRYVYYRLADPKVLDLLHLAWRIQGGGDHAFGWRQDRKPRPCKCPSCTTDVATVKSRN